MLTAQPEKVRAYLLKLQARICKALEEEEEGTCFNENKWIRKEGGGGISRVLTAGSVFEKAGINFSDIKGDKLPNSATIARPQLTGARFRAMGVSVVAHPGNPHVPTAHMNVRFFCALPKDCKPIWWFGGGFDMTPYYGYREDAIHWHRTARSACEAFGKELYKKLKLNCDNYFYIPHREEPRGIGGIFFDDYDNGGFEEAFSLMKSVGDHFLPAYQPIVARRKKTPRSEKERQFQLYRRGRYVEFNLVYDRGTLFGLQSKGRAESILMSLPPLARWDYAYQPESDSPEEKLYKVFLKPQDWADFRK